jgi:hypothetical protein
VKPRTRYFIGLALVALSCGSAREGCVGGPWALESATQLQSERIDFAFVLDAASARTEKQLRLRLTGLPKLWPAEGAVREASIEVNARWFYPGNDVVTQNIEYPPITTRSSTESHSVVISGAPFYNRAEWAFGIFDAACSGDGVCCPFGSTECTADVVVGVERGNDGFGELEFRWQLEASASIDDCPLQDAEPSLELEAIP